MKTPLEIAFTQLGVKEIPGTGRHNPEVVKYFQETGFTSVIEDETSWCATFVNWCLIKAGKEQSYSLRARSLMNIGEPVMEPQLGDIAVFWRISPDAPEGHVGFFINQDGSNIYVLGGNQSNMVNITAYPGTQLLGYRRV